MPAEYKMSLAPKTIEDAAPRAKAILEAMQAKLGVIPNLYAFMTTNPGLLETYTHGYNLFREESGFSPVEQEVVLLTVSRENGCQYCVAVHSSLGDAMSKVPPAVTDAIRDGRPIDDPKLAALHALTRTMVVDRGLPTRADVDAFLAAGYSERHILDIVLAIAVKTLSNYTNHLFHTSLDSMFESRAWKG